MLLLHIRGIASCGRQYGWGNQIGGKSRAEETETTANSEKFWLVIRVDLFVDRFITTFLLLLLLAKYEFPQ